MLVRPSLSAYFCALLAPERLSAGRQIREKRRKENIYGRISRGNSCPRFADLSNEGKGCQDLKPCSAGTDGFKEVKLEMPNAMLSATSARSCCKVSLTCPHPLAILP